jgi:hypothetical protein
VTCAACGAQSSDGSAFCAACGAPITQSSSIPGSVATSTTTAAPPTRVFTPEAERAVRQAAAQAQGVVRNLGPEKTASLIGGALGILGAILPFYSIPNVEGMLDSVSVPTASLVNQGPLGAIIIVLALVLAAGPFFSGATRSIALTGFGLSAAIIGMLLSDRAGFSFYGQAVVPDFGAGYYLALVGFAILAWVYGRRANKGALSDRG